MKIRCILDVMETRNLQEDINELACFIKWH